LIFNFISLITTATTAETVTSTIVLDEEEPAIMEGEIVEEVVVTGSRVRQKLKDTTVHTELVGAKELEGSGAENLTEVLEEHPGVELERITRGTGVRLMGLDPAHTLILVDGERVTGRLGGSIDPTRFNLENVDQVEIVKGAGSAIYGSEAVGGVINIITRRPAKPFESSLHLSYGSFQTVDAVAAAGGRLGPFSTHVSGGFHRSDGFTIEECPEIVVRPCDPEVGNLQTTGPKSTSWNIANTTILDLDDRAFLRARIDYRTDAREADDQFGTTRTSLRSQTQSVWSAALSPEVELEDGRFRGTFSFSQFDLDIDQAAGQSRDELYQTIGHGQLQIDQLVLGTNLFSLGLEGILERQGGESFATGEDGSPVVTDFLEGGDRDRQRVAAFIQDEWTPIEDPFFISVVPSLRVDVDSQFGSALTPRFAVRYDPFDWFAFRASYGFGFRAPTFEELYLEFINRGSNYLVQGNPDLQPERSQALNITGSLEPWRYVGASGTFYYINLDNLIDTQRADRTVDGLTLFQHRNVESARSTGVEATLDVRPIPELVFSFGYVFNATRDRALDRPLDGRARHKGTVRATFRMESIGVTAGVRSQIYGPRIFFRDIDGDGIDNPLTVKPYATIDFRAEFAPFVPFDLENTFLEHLALFAGFENLLDYGDPELTPITPRSFYGGIAAKYEIDAEDTP
jgi:outer membrane receptor for ferrienterochelin and colicins